MLVLWAFEPTRSADTLSPTNCGATPKLSAADLGVWLAVGDDRKRHGHLRPSRTEHVEAETHDQAVEVVGALQLGARHRLPSFRDHELAVDNLAVGELAVNRGEPDPDPSFRCAFSLL